MFRGNGAALFSALTRAHATILGRYRPVAPAVSPQLDTLRGVSALIVVVAHCYQIIIAPIYPGVYSINGLLAQAGVMIFFVLSGFLITKSLTRNISANGSLDLTKYVIDRFDRIYPPLLLGVAVLIACYLLAPLIFQTGTAGFIRTGGFVARDGLALDGFSIAGVLVFLNGFAVDGPPSNAPLWSLPFEVWYYAIAGLIAWRPVAGLIVGGALLFLLGALTPTFLVYSSVWFGGAAVALLHNWDIDFVKVGKVAAGLALAASAIVAAAYIKSSFAWTGRDDIDGRYIVAFNVAFGLAAAGALYLLNLGRLSVSTALSSSADYSYTLYATHFPFLLLVYGALQSYLNDVISAVAVAAVCAAFSIIAAKAMAGAVEGWRPIKNLLARRSAALV